MSDYKLTLSARDESGKKAKLIRDSGKIPSVVYGGKTPLLTASDYNETEKVLRAAGYHSPIDLEIDKKTILGIVKTVALDPVSRKIINIEFNEIKKNALVEATTPIKIENFEASDASKAHLALLQVMEEIDVKAKPSDPAVEAEKREEEEKNAEEVSAADVPADNGQKPEEKTEAGQ